MKPTLTLHQSCGISYYSDPYLFKHHGIRVAFTLRHGGVSKHPYKSLNLGQNVGDNLANVQANRLSAMHALDISISNCDEIVSAQQVHGTDLFNVQGPVGEVPSCDGLYSAQPNIPLLMCFADCVPIILVEPTQKVIGVVHSGWKGTLNNIVGKTVLEMSDNYKVSPHDMLAYIGPYITLQDFTISREIADQFFYKFDTFESGISYVYDGDRVKIDLGCACLNSLERVGVQSCNITNLGANTVSLVEDYFSYRAENQVTGRHGAIACICA